MIRYSWRVYGTPKGQPRPRLGRRGSVYNPPTAKAWKQSIKRLLAAEGYPEEPLTGPVSVSLLFRMGRPPSHYLKSGRLKKATKREHLQTPDIDNLSKAVLDAMTDLGVWVDDCNVIHLEVHKRWSKQIDAGVSIEIRAPH